MTAYEVEYNPSTGQPARSYGGPYTSRAEAIAAARECARQCLPEHSGGNVHVYRQGEPIWWWTEHTEGGYGGQETPTGDLASVRL